MAKSLRIAMLLEEENQLRAWTTSLSLIRWQKVAQRLNR
jgi:hypothetical protein